MGITFFHISLKYTLRKQAFYYNIYKDIYVFFKEYGLSLLKKQLADTFIIEVKRTRRTKNEQSCGKMGRNPANRQDRT